MAQQMRILVTGGAGFIGSHTTDRLIEAGHRVTIIDALRAPVHRNNEPNYVTPGAEFLHGDVRDRDLMTRLLHEADAVFHFAAYQDYMPDFSTFFDINVTGTALIYEIAVAEKLALKRIVVASSQAVMGEGLYSCPEHGEQTPQMRSDTRLATGEWEIPCPVCAGTMSSLPCGEDIANPQNPYGISKLAQERIALNLGSRYAIPTVAMRYSIVQGPRQSVYNAYSGACRIFCMHYARGTVPVVYEDGKSLRDYVNIADVVDANLLVLDDERAQGRMFNVGGGKAYTTAEFCAIVQKAYGADEPGAITGEYRFGDTRHIVSDISALQALGWRPRRSPADSVADYAQWLATLDDPDAPLAEMEARMRDAGVVRKSVA